MTNQQTSVATFRSLHESGCFVLPNPWDIGSAVYLHHLGFKALATTSAGFAFSRGLPDEVSALSLEDVLEHNRDIAGALTIPATPLYEKEMAGDRIKAARAAIDQSGIPVVLTGRCEAWLVGDPNAFKVSIERLTAYAEAGADCLYAPGVGEPEQISEIVKAVAPRPVNVLAFRPDPTFTLSKLTDLGVRRISVGSALARVAWGSFIKAAQSLATTGTFESLVGGASFAELNKVFGHR